MLICNARVHGIARITLARRDSIALPIDLVLLPLTLSVTCRCLVLDHL